jgi:hypothetical protein
MLSACGNNVVGKYTVSEITMGDTTWSKAEFEEKKDSEDLSLTEKMFVEMCSAFFDMNYEFKEDGVCVKTHKVLGVEKSVEGTYTVDGDKVVVTSEGDSDELTFKDNTLKFTDKLGENTQLIIVFAKN